MPCRNAATRQIDCAYLGVFMLQPTPARSILDFESFAGRNRFTDKCRSPPGGIEFISKTLSVERKQRHVLAWGRRHVVNAGCLQRGLSLYTQGFPTATILQLRTQQRPCPAKNFKSRIAPAATALQRNAPSILAIVASLHAELFFAGGVRLREFLRKLCWVLQIVGE